MPKIQREKRWLKRYFDDCIDDTQFVGYVASDFVENAALLVDLARHTACDVVVLDMERTALDLAQLRAISRAMYSAGLLSLVRVPAGDRALFEKVWDTGINAVTVPMPKSLKQAADYVRWSRFPPEGNRSVWWGGAFMSYDFLERDYRLYAAMGGAPDNNVILVQPRTAEDIASLDEILGVEGITGVFVDSLELAVNLGMKPEDEVFLEVLGGVFEKTKAREQIAVGFAAPTAEQTAALLGHGMNVVLAGSDSQMFFELLNAKMGELKAIER